MRSKIISFLLTVLIIFFAILPLFLISPPEAGAWIVSDLVQTALHKVEYAWDRFKETEESALKQGGAIAFRNILNTYTATLTQQIADWAARGFKGQQPMFIEDPHFWEKAGEAALGEFIDQVAQESFLEQGLCEPIPAVKLQIILSLAEPGTIEMPEEELCSFDKIQENIEQASKEKLVQFDMDVKQGKSYQMSVELESIVSANKALSTLARLDALAWINSLEWRQARIETEVDKIMDLVEKMDETEEDTPEELASLRELRESLLNLDAGYQQRKEAIDALGNFQMADQCKVKSKQDFCTNDVCRDYYCEGINMLESEEDKVAFCEDNFENNCLKSAVESSVFLSQLRDWEASGEMMITEMDKIIEEEMGILIAEANRPKESGSELINSSLTQYGTDLGALKYLDSKSEEQKKDVEEVEKTDALIRGEIKATESGISGIVQAPAVFGEESLRSTARNPVEQNLIPYTGEWLADTINIVATTYFNWFIQEIFENGFTNPYAKDNVEIEPGLGGSISGSSVVIKPATPGALINAVGAVKLVKGGFTPLLEEHYAVCPIEDINYALPTNCVVDDGLVQAAREEMTIREAMEQDLLHSHWLVGGDPERIKSQSNIQYTGVYTLENIKKLRKARVVPLGMEIAAQKIVNGEVREGTPPNDVPNYEITLEEVVNGFSDASNPFYHLVDPNWVLKSFAFSCNNKGYSAIPLPESPRRQETCVDWQSCLREDENGDCLAYGYCLAEENIWRLEGDPCSSQYAGCATFEREKDGQQFALLAQTLDKSDCHPENVGCQWYCLDWSETLGESGNWACHSPGKNYIAQCVLRDEEGNEIKCEEENPYYSTEEGGCICYYVDEESGEAAECLVPEGSNRCFIGPALEKENVVLFNRAVEKCDPSQEGCSEFINIKPGLATNLLANGNFLDLKEGSKPDDDETVADNFYGWDSEGLIRSYAISEGDNRVLKIIGSGKFISQIEINPQPWERYFSLSASVKIKEGAPEDVKIEGSISIGDVNNNNSNFKILAGENDWQEDTPKERWITVWQTISLAPGIDKFNFEIINSGPEILVKESQVIETNKPILDINDLPFYRGYGESGLVYYKEAPDYYHCYDQDPGNDNLKCFNFLKSCDAESVGCELYSPKMGGPDIPGIVNYSNYCPAVCDGYNIFRQQATNFDNPQEGLAFIPSSATACPASEVGCAEFTNLNTEQREYFSYVRQCVKTDENDTPIIGDDGEPADENDQCAYYYTWIGNDQAGYQLEKHLLKQGEDGEPAEIDNSSNQFGSCQGEEDALKNPHCKEFYDAQGNVSYHIWENTISCAPDCFLYRKTMPASALGNQTLFMAMPSQGRSCSAANVGCREYKGPTANNRRQIFFDDFEDEDEVWEGGNWSEESTNQYGHSMKVENEDSVSRSVSQETISGFNTYNLSFWVKGSGEYKVYFDNGLGDKIYPQGNENYSLENESHNWQELKFDSLYFNREVGENERLVIEGPSLFYVDNVILTQIQDSLYLIKDSWYTPNVCQPSMIGCAAYNDRADQTHFLHSFASFCPEEEVGCQALIKTQNSSFAFEKEFNKGNDEYDDEGNLIDDQDDNITIAKDEIVYRILDERFKCSADKKGCQRLGKPVFLFSEEEGASYFDDVYLINNPDYYDWRPILCSSEGVNCEKFKVLEGYGPMYFKDPGEKLCEYKPVVEGDKGGWYQKGTNLPCCYQEDGSPYVLENDIYGIYDSSDPNYQGYGGICSFDQAGCTEFIAKIPSFDDTGNLIDIKNISSYYLDNDKLDRASCQGEVGMKDGCLLFSNPNKKDEEGNLFQTYDSTATYSLSHEAIPSDTRVNAQSCSSDDENCDANEILKVKRDRQCAQWLSCISYRNEWSSSSGNYLQVCDAFARCDELKGEGANTSCGHFIDPPEIYYDYDETTGNLSLSVLTEENYQDRDVSWLGLDYSGDTLYNTYPLEKLVSVPFSVNNIEQWGLGYYQVNGDVYDIYGNEENNDAFSPIPKTCRLFPENDSPFNANLSFNLKTKYPKVNYCHPDGQGNEPNPFFPQCQCNYVKADYSGQTLYFNYGNNPPDGIKITGGEYQVCDPSGGDPHCLSKSEQTTYIGQRGYCLEPDTSKPGGINSCLNWWPGEVAGDYNIFHQFQEAGYWPANNQWYCVEELAEKDRSFQLAEDDGGNIIYYFSYGPDEDGPEYCENATNEDGSCTDSNNTCANVSGGDSNVACYYPNLTEEDTSNFRQINQTFCMRHKSEDNNSWFVDYLWPRDDSLLAKEIVKKDNIDKITFVVDTDNDYSEDVWINEQHQNSCDFGSRKIERGGGMSGMPPITLNSNDTYDYYHYYDKCACDGPQLGWGWEWCDCGVSYDDSNWASLTIKANWNDDGTLKNFQLGFRDNNKRGGARIRGGTIHLKNGCKVVVRITDPDSLEPAKAYTNRVNGVRDYDEDDGAVDSKTYDTSCSPWGAIKTWDENSYILLAGEDECYNNALYEGAVYNSINPLAENLFAKTYEAKVLNVETLEYDEDGLNSGSEYITDNTSNGINRPPYVGSVTELTNGRYNLKQVNQITINNQDNDDIEDYGILPVSLKFYAWADANQMPIRQIIVDWDDGQKSQMDEMMAKNHKPRCCESNESCTNLDGIQNKYEYGNEDFVLYSPDAGSQCNNQECLNFANIPEACVSTVGNEPGDAYFLFNHIYTCSGPESEGWNSGEGRCEFTPKVYVKDNWGWCNGGEDGVYAGEDDEGNEINCSEVDGAGTAYDGVIVVYPPQQ